MPASPARAPPRAEGVGGVLFGKPLLALGCRGEALQKGSTPCGSSTRGGAEGGKPPNDDPAPFWASLWPHDGIRRAPPLASAAVTALAALAFASATALASLGGYSIAP